MRGWRSLKVRASQINSLERQFTIHRNERRRFQTNKGRRFLVNCGCFENYPIRGRPARNARDLEIKFHKTVRFTQKVDILHTELHFTMHTRVPGAFKVRN